MHCILLLPAIALHSAQLTNPKRRNRNFAYKVVQAVERAGVKPTIHDRGAESQYSAVRRQVLSVHTTA